MGTWGTDYARRAYWAMWGLGANLVEAFWSITTYDNEGYLEKNELERYSLGSKHDLSYNPDGSLDVYLSNVRPQGALNKVPTPVEEFKILLRIYWPSDEVLAGDWSLPQIDKLQ